MNRQRGEDAKTALAAIVAMLPGFALPFILTWRLSAKDSDQFILALSIVTTLTTVVSSAIELNTISELGRHLKNGQMPTAQRLSAYRRRTLGFGTVAVLLVFPALSILYASASSWSSEFLLLCALMVATPIVGIFSASRSGMLIAMGNAVLPVGTQFLRTSIAILLLLLWPDLPLLLLPVAILAGESARWILLTARFRARLNEYRADQDVQLQSNGLVWQTLSSGTSQAAPVIDRMFLSTAPAGSISMYELADKLFFAAVQFLNYGFLLRRVGQWSRIPQLPLSEARALFRRDLIALVGISVVTGALGTLVLIGLLLVPAPLPEIWRSSISWAVIALISLPATVVNYSASRLIIIARKQHYLMWFSLLTLVATLALDALFFSFYGAFGIIIAATAVRFLSLIAYSITLWNIFPSLALQSTR